MERIELIECDCCGLNEDCTEEYISQVKLKFEGKWLCGLCSEAVSDEAMKMAPHALQAVGMDEAVMAHMSFCRQYKLNPAVQVADGMKLLLRRRSGKNLSGADKVTNDPSSKYTRSSTIAPIQVSY